MARDINGNYTVPNGSTAVSGSTISSSAYNAFLADLQVSLTDSLSRSGKGGLLSALTFEDGTANAPTLAFSDEPTTGIYRAAAGEINISIGGVKVLSVSGTAITSEVPHKQLVGGNYADCTDTLANFTIAGAWNHTGGLKHTGGIVMSHSNAALTSGKITFTQGSGPPVGGSDGDMVFYYT